MESMEELSITAKTILSIALITIVIIQSIVLWKSKKVDIISSLTLTSIGTLVSFRFYEYYVDVSSLAFLIAIFCTSYTFCYISISIVNRLSTKLDSSITKQ